jgi:diacylglycerol kinase family enzyme
MAMKRKEVMGLARKHAIVSVLTVGFCETVYKVGSIVVEADPPQLIHLDGDIRGQTPILVQVIPQIRKKIPLGDPCVSLF